MRKFFRSSVTGRFVTRLFARLFPRETQGETRQAFFAEDTPEELIEALKNADYSHLPELRK